MEEIVADLNGASCASEVQAATLNDCSRAASPSTAGATKPSMVAAALGFIDEYTDLFDELSNRGVYSAR